MTETKVQPSNKAASNDADGTLAYTTKTIIKDTPMFFNSAEDYRMETDLTFGKVIIECACKT